MIDKEYMEPEIQTERQRIKENIDLVLPEIRVANKYKSQQEKSQVMTHQKRTIPSMPIS